MGVLVAPDCIKRRSGEARAEAGVCYNTAGKGREAGRGRFTVRREAIGDEIVRQRSAGAESGKGVGVDDGKAEAVETAR